MTLMTVISQYITEVETAFLKVHRDIDEALDEGSTSKLIMFNLSVANGVIGHPILMKHL